MRNLSNNVAAPTGFDNLYSSCNQPLLTSNFNQNSSDNDLSYFENIDQNFEVANKNSNNTNFNFNSLNHINNANFESIPTDLDTNSYNFNGTLGTKLYNHGCD